MPSYLFSALLLVVSVVFCALCGAVSADPVGWSVDLFKKGLINASDLKGDFVERLNVDYVFSPSLVAIGEDMVALAEVKRTDDKNDILAEYIEAGMNKEGKKTIKNNEKNWKTYLTLTNEKTGLITFGSVAKNGSIYILSASQAGSEWNFKLIVGTIINGATSAKKKMTWQRHDVSKHFQHIQEKLKDAYPHTGTGFLTEDGQFVFILKGSHGLNAKFYLIASSKDPESKFTVNFRKEDSADCYSSFFPWDKKIFMVPTRCSDNSKADYKVKESNDMGTTWTEASGQLAERLNGLEGKGRLFTSIDINGKRVLLFTERELKSDASSKKVTIDLFAGHEKHTENVGRIVVNVESLSAGSFVYTNDQLFFLSYQETERYVDKIILSSLDEQLQKIKELLKKWPRDGK